MFLRVLSLPLLVGISALLASESLLAAPPGRKAGRNETTCCTTNTGRTACGDIMPSECNGRELKIYDRQGNRIAIIPARITPEERAALEAAKKREQEKIEKEQGQIRRDKALLDTYARLSDIDRMQKYTEDSVNTEINNILVKIGASQKKKNELAQEASPYDKQNIPPELAKSIRDEDMELQTQNELLAAKQKDLERIRQRFASDRSRFIELTKEQNKN